MADLDPYAESLRVVWHEPTQYDLTVHGPPYLPSRMKLSSVQKAEVQEVLKEAAAPDLLQGLGDDVGKAPLTALLGCLQGLSLMHQTFHWNSKGPSSFEDHKLFERIYNESQEGIDSLAERAIGLGLPTEVKPQVQASMVLQMLSVLNADAATDSQSMVETALKGEAVCAEFISEVIDALMGNGQLTPGVSNLLEGIADVHETFVYLLKQRSSEVRYSYVR